MQLICGLLFSWLLTHSSSAAHPVSPCPDVFNYEGENQENNQWYGEIWLKTTQSLVGIRLDIELDRPSNQMVSWMGVITTYDNVKYTILNLIQRLKPGISVRTMIMVKFNISNGSPRVRSIRFNGYQICPEDSTALTSNVEESFESQSSQKSGRLNPDFGEDVNEYPVHSNVYNNKPSIQSNNNSNKTKKTSNERPDDTNCSLSTNNPRNGVDNPSKNTSRPTTTGEPSFSTKKTSNNNSGQSKPDTDSRPTVQQKPSWSIQNPSSSFPSTTIDAPRLSDICGQVRMTVPLVTYGQSTHRGQWPWHVALYKIEGINVKYHCGGSLVSKNKVVTAAHCVMEAFYEKIINSSKLVVHLGKYHQAQYNEQMGVQTRSVTQIAVYPMFNKTTCLGDIAVLTLATAVVLSPYVAPVCLWDDNSVDLNEVEGKDGTVVGWGWDETHKPSVELKMAQMLVVSRETCISSLPQIFSISTSEKTFCAGFRNDTSVCNGDSGGGMVFNKGSRWYLRGIVSSSVSEPLSTMCDPKHYAVFTDAAKYLDFIKENL